MTPIAHFSRRYRFSASHRLHVATLSDQQNRDVFGKCNNPFGHGHNYTLEVTVAGPVDPSTGFVVDMPSLDALVREQVLDRFDHEDLNHDGAFTHTVPSTENVVFFVEQLLRDRIASLASNPQSFNSQSSNPQSSSPQSSKLRLVRLRVEETSNNSFDLPLTPATANAPQLF